MLLSFTLSMPNNNAWNGKWSGEGQLYVIIKNIGSSQKAKMKAESILKQGYYHYNFGDGWAAGITVKEVVAGEATKLRRKSRGFYGYDWMVNSIWEIGKIDPDLHGG